MSSSKLSLTLSVSTLIGFLNSDVFKYVFGDTIVFSDLESAKLSKQKIRMVTLSGELLEVSGAITGGSKVNKDLAYRFGINNDIDEAYPIKQRLSVIEEALNKSDNNILVKTNPNGMDPKRYE